MAGTKHRVMIVTGEASGDLHGGALVRAVGRVAPTVRFFGVGSQRLREAGCDILIDSGELSAMGLVEVAGRLPVILRHFKTLKTLLHGPARPDLLVLIDFPDFNLRLAAQAKRAGVPVLYFISPKFWAWRQGRLKTVARVVDRMAVIFPFEVPYYRQHGVDVRFVGNPLLDDLAKVPDRSACREKFGLPGDAMVVGLFPGSRSSEIRYNLATMLETGRRLRDRHAGVRFLLPVAPNLDPAVLRDQVERSGLPVEFTPGELFEAARACDAALVVSGTATLQTALVGTPLAVIYKCSPLSFAIGRRLVKIPFISLVNIICGEEVVREFIQEQAEPVAMAGELSRLLEAGSYRDRLLARLGVMREEMGEPGCAGRVANMVMEMLDQKRRGA